jgi:penicillin-binding protein 2
MKTGFAFGEHIRTERIKKRRNHHGENSGFSIRGFLLPFLVVGGVVILIAKLFHLQIVDGAEYRALSDSNRIRTEVIRAPRGVIFDRFGIPLVQNEPGFRKVKECHPEQSEGSLPAGRQVKKDSSATPQNDKLCSQIISRDEALALIAEGKGVEVAAERVYLYKDAMSHVLGYTGQISKEELDSAEYQDYSGLDWVGKTGIEREYEHILRGIDGKKLNEVDAMGKTIRSLGTTDPVPGQDITLTIDAKIQEAVYAASSDMKRGAIIVSNPKGEILAMASVPSFDPNLFTRDTTYKTASESAYKNTEDILTDRKSEPLLNRAIGGAYPPGSTFKIVTSAAGLEKKIIDENYRVKDTGILRVGEFSYANWYFTNYGRTEPGELDVVRALSRSNDIFFYKLAEKVNAENLSEMARKMGLGDRTGIDLGGEVKGLVPSNEWKKENIGEVWYLGDTYHYGIGQGYLLATPLQVNMFTTVIANGGKLYQPRLIKNEKPKTKNEEVLSEKTVDLIRRGMIDSCTSKIGVAWPLYEMKVENGKLKVDGKNILEVKNASGSAKASELREIKIACKTGTSQHGGEETLPHAWITLFAPAYDPEIVVTVLDEESGEGSNEAAPIAKKILEAYFTE